MHHGSLEAPARFLGALPQLRMSGSRPRSQGGERIGQPVDAPAIEEHEVAWTTQKSVGNQTNLGTLGISQSNHDIYECDLASLSNGGELGWLSTSWQS